MSDTVSTTLHLPSLYTKLKNQSSKLQISVLKFCGDISVLLRSSALLQDRTTAFELNNLQNRYCLLLGITHML